MRNFWKLSAVSATALTAIALSFTAPATAQMSMPMMAPTPSVYVVMFRADWCAPCKVVEPNISQALNSLSDPSIEYVTFDITDPGRSELSAHRAFDRQIVPQYNSWMGVTGFAAIIDGDTKQTLGCVNMMYDAQSTASHIRNLKTYAVANQPSMDFTCPEPNAPR